LDGGGVLALSELCIIKEILIRLQIDLKLPSVPLPCDVFDVIGGSGSGGIIALLLGRLRLNVEDAIECFIIISQTIHTSGLSKNSDKIRDCMQFVVACVLSLCRIFNSNTNALPHSEIFTRFVCALPLAALKSSTKPVCFRNFRSRQHCSFSCKVWEAACATTSYVGVFPPIRIGPPLSAQKFVDAGIGYNNPAEIVVQETESLFPPSRHQIAVVSLGAGHPGVETYRSHDVLWKSLLYDIARDCERTADRMASKRDSYYFRFNVAHGLQGIRLEDWVDPGFILSQSESYVSTSVVNRSIDSLVGFLVKRHLQPPGQFRLPCELFTSHLSNSPRKCFYCGSPTSNALNFIASSRFWGL
ncbi:acyl transferase/acyl hydrolase/lysophospholipase, partial [Flagelloscypha sp. PMI_526]